MLVKITHNECESYFSFVGNYIPNWIRYKAKNIQYVHPGELLGPVNIGKFVYRCVDTQAGRIKTLVGLRDESNGFIMDRPGNGVPNYLLPEDAVRGTLVI